MLLLVSFFVGYFELGITRLLLFICFILVKTGVSCILWGFLMLCREIDDPLECYVLNFL